MRLLDLNVVLPAHRDDHVDHRRCLDVLTRIDAERQPFAVPLVVQTGLVRLATDRRVFERPTSMPEVFAFLRIVLGRPHHRVLQPGARHLELFERMCVEGEMAGRKSTDAHLAALAIEHGAEVVSFDRDFARFPGLRWSVPD